MKLSKVSKIIGVSLSALAFTACGGGGGGSNGGSNSSVTGKAFYIDSAVSGVNYKCGDIEDITGKDGSFRFEKGSSCTFYLGDIELRDVSSDVLKDGENLYETDISVARVLQSLDYDHNLANGITINADIVQLMINNGLEALPESSEDVEKLIKAIADAGGMYVSVEDAQSHIEANNPNLYSFRNLHYLYDNAPEDKYKVEYTYDNNGNKLTMKAVSNSCYSNQTVESKYTYDIKNNVVTENYTDTEVYTYPNLSDESVTIVETGTIVYTFNDQKILQKAKLIHEGYDYNYNCGPAGGCIIEENEKYILNGTFTYDYNNENILQNIAYKFLDSTEPNDTDIGTMYFNEQGKVIKDESHGSDSSYDLTTYEYSKTGKIQKIVEYYTYPDTAEYTGGKSTYTRIYNDDEYIISMESNSESLNGSFWYKYKSSYDGTTQGSCKSNPLTSSWEDSEGNSGTSSYTYHTNGKMKSSESTQINSDGSTIESQTTYNANGNILTSTYKSISTDGSWHRNESKYDTNGNLLSSAYSGEHPDGTWYESTSTYHPNGNIKTNMYKGSNPDGSWYSTYDIHGENGNMLSRVYKHVSLDGTKNEEESTYYENGNMKKSITIYTDPDGMWTKTTRTYDENGNIIDEIVEQG